MLQKESEDKREATVRLGDGEDNCADLRCGAPLKWAKGGKVDSGYYEHRQCKVCCEGEERNAAAYVRRGRTKGVQFYRWLLLDFGFLETGDGLRVGDGEWSLECV